MTEQWQEDLVEKAERERVTATEVSWALREVNRASADLDRKLAARLELRPLDYAAMNHLMTAPHPIGPVELAHQLGISTGSGTELVDRLERAGHLHRNRDATDRRRVVLHPTPAAVERIVTELSTLFTDIDGLADELSSAEQETIARFLRNVAQHLKAFTA